MPELVLNQVQSDYEDNDREDLEESEVRILLCASEFDTATTSIVTRQTWDLVHHLRLMQSKGIDRSLGFDFSGNLAVCPCQAVGLPYWTVSGNPLAGDPFQLVGDHCAKVRLSHVLSHHMAQGALPKCLRVMVGPGLETAG